jgi:hypothetical protein
MGRSAFPSVKSLLYLYICSYRKVVNLIFSGLGRKTRPPSCEREVTGPLTTGHSTQRSSLLVGAQRWRRGERPTWQRDMEDVWENGDVGEMEDAGEMEERLRLLR